MERERERETECESEFERDGGFIWECKTERGRVREVKKPSFVSGKTGVDYLVKKKCRTTNIFTISCHNCYIVEYCNTVKHDW